jgi:hypothetical protein
MRMTGFTAEAAVSNRGAIYAMTASEGAPREAKVVPEACVNIGPCRVCVDVSWWPPRACLSFSCLGFSRSFCVP